MENISRLNENCFACGKNNPIGPKLEFSIKSENQVETSFTPPQEWSGWGEIVHGGLQTVILDEISAWTIILLTKRFSLTIKASVEFLRPLYVNESLTATAKIEKIEEGIIYVSSVILNEKKKICTKGRFIFKEVSEEKLASVAVKR
ncbi:MAG: PaaI family thioesterase [Candidatus Heimdallarchaeum endolithica]|uniref:Acyl-coenzyme A thioesterase THEM4 n=1 Tax=Candidatus Heimdallarchaeum endolithica TaxID=2876572 RepID=A0A9Y1BQC4_9ARCH|nr:MAG: PaaI family thioesterase [Candidatus Heimdallarchaeum endolithica]